MLMKTEGPSEFRLSELDLKAMPEIYDAFLDYSNKRFYYSEAFKALNDAIKKLHTLLDGLLRTKGLVPEGMDWKLKEEGIQEGLLITIVSAEPKRRGRRRRELPLQSLSP
jgi:hypothetical protein